MAPLAARSRKALPYLLVAVLILFRTLPYILLGRDLFDSDEGVAALMGKHLAEGRALPIFCYGSKYLLAQSSWMAAPLFYLFGASVAAFRVPLVLLNLIIAYLLIFLLKRDCKLSTWQATFCSLWFLLPSLRTSFHLMDGGIDILQPFFYLLVIWIFRKRTWIGFLAGVGIAGRPFVGYGVAAILLLELHELRASELHTKGQPWVGPWIKSAARWTVGIVVSFAGLHWIAAHYSANYLFGNSIPLRIKPFRFMLEYTRGFFAELVPQILGLQFQRLKVPYSDGTSSHFTIWGLAFSALGISLLYYLLRTTFKNRRELLAKSLTPEFQFAFYLVLVGLLSFGTWVVMSPAPPVDDIHYNYQLLLGMIGIYAIQIKWGKSTCLKWCALVFLGGCLLSNAAAVGLTWKDLDAIHERHPTENLIHYLEDHQIHAAMGGSIWAAHNLTFQTGEKIPVGGGLHPPGPQNRIPQDNDRYFATPEEFRAEIRMDPCPAGTVGQPVEIWWVCR